MVGYIITNHGSVMRLTRYQADEPAVLCIGDYAHLFKSRRAALKAIERTIEYAERHGLAQSWDVHTNRIHRVRHT
jgi:hypothetical protein